MTLTIPILAATGGMFALLTFIHFFIDWIFQTHSEAMVKHNNWLIRAKHCLIYTSPFVLFLVWCHVKWYMIIAAALVLFFSHFVEDTYIPVLLWAKYIRRPPEMRWKLKRSRWASGHMVTELHSPDGTQDADSYSLECGAKTWRESLMMDYHVEKLTKKQAKKQLDHHGFLEFISTPMGKILMVAIDQIIHIAFLLPIAYMIVCK